MAAFNWRSYFAAIGPPWVHRYWGERLWGAIAYLSDLMTEGMSQAVKAHLLEQDTSPFDALRPVGNEREMPRYPGETDANHRLRLLDAWNAYEKGGTAAAIIDQLGFIGLSNVVVRSQHDGWTFENPKDTSQWSRFVVVIEQTHPWSVTPRTYGDGHVFGSALAYGTDATPNEVYTVKAIVDKWRPVHSHWPYILVVLAHEYYGDPALVYGGGAVYGGSTIKWHNA